LAHGGHGNLLGVNWDPERSTIVLIAATALEANALRRELPRALVVETGIALANVTRPLGQMVVSCGFAGGLRTDLPTGTLLLPREIGRPDGRVRGCDAQLVDAFAEGARRLGIEPVFDPLLTSDTIVNGAARAQWAARGFAGVDMETGRLDAERIAAVRVVLDTPHRELSQDWANPPRALLKPWNWPQALWLAREAPRAARLAARVVAQGLGT
jgi:4-hydroxy-3-methylbut-2-en-1-yl diphosphate reductase